MSDFQGFSINKSGKTAPIAIENAKKLPEGHTPRPRGSHSASHVQALPLPPPPPETEDGVRPVFLPLESGNPNNIVEQSKQYRE